MFPISSSLGPPLPPLTLSLAQGMVAVAEMAHLSAPTGSAAKRGPLVHPACLHQVSAGAWGRQQQDGHPAERAPAQKCTAVPAPPHEYWLAPSCGSSQAQPLRAFTLCFPSFPSIAGSQRHLSGLYWDIKYNLTLFRNSLLNLILCKNRKSRLFQQK